MRKSLSVIALLCLVVLGLSPPAHGQFIKEGTIAASASSCTSAGGARVTLGLPPDAGSTSIVLSGTWAGTVEFKGTADGSNYSSIIGEPIPSGAGVSSATATGTWIFNVAAMKELCVYASTYTSGTIRVRITSSVAFARKSTFPATPTFPTMSEGQPLTVDSTGVLTSTPAVRHADPFAGATAGAKIAAAWADLPSTGGTVDARGLEGAQTLSSDMFSGLTKPLVLLLGCGTYGASVTQSIATPNVQVIGSGPCTVIQATDAAATPVLRTTSNDTYLDNLVIDGDSLAANGINTSGLRTKIGPGVEIKNTTTYGFQCFGACDDADVQGYVHDTLHGIATDSLTGATRIKVHNVKVKDVTGNGVRLSGVNHGELSAFTIDTAAVGVYAYGPDFVDIHDGVIRDTTSFGVHVDTGGGCKITGVWVIGSGNVSIFPEMTPCEVNGNSSWDSAGDGITLGAGGTYTPVQKNALENTTGLTANTNITLAADAVDFQEGAASLQVDVAAGFTTGYLFYEDLGATPDTDYDGQNWEQIWVKSDTALASGVLQLKVSSLQNHSTQLLTYDLPNIPAATWVQVRLYAETWSAKIFGQVKSWGIHASSDPGVVVLHFDDYTLTRNQSGYRGSKNKVYFNQGSFGIGVGGGVTAELDGNYVEGPCIDNGGTCRAYVANFGSTVTFRNNEAVMKDRGPSTYFLELLNSSTVHESGSRSSGQDTLFQVTSGTLNYGALTTTPGTSGTDLAWVAGVLNVPNASATARGVIASSGSQTLAPNFTFTGSLNQQGNLTLGSSGTTIIKEISRTLTDATATNFLVITTTDEAGSTDGGGWSLKVDGLCANNASSTATNAAVTHYIAVVNHISIADGTGANSTVSEILDMSGGGGVALVGTGNVITIVMTVVDTSNYIKTIQLNADWGAAGGSTGSCKLVATLNWTGLATAPTMVVAP